MGEVKSAIPIEKIESRIYGIRGQRIMLDHDLAELYGVQTKALKQAVSRNIERFPSDFMFILTYQEFANLRSQIVTSSYGQWGGTRYKPMAFTEQGVAMLSSVLRSERAVKVNIEIMRAFVRIRGRLVAHKELARKLKELEERLEKHDEDIGLIFEAIRELMTPPDEPPKKIGFEVSEGRVSYRKKKKQ
jgi:phage regulator Rha-like protein